MKRIESLSSLEILIWFVGGAATLILGMYVRSNLIFTGLAFAATTNAVWMLNRRLPQHSSNPDPQTPGQLGQHMQSSTLASIRRQYRWLAVCGDAALIYLVVDHFVM